MLRKIIHSYSVSFSGLSRETWLLSFVILINRCGYMAVPFMSMYITQSMHRSIADAGLVITLFGVGSVVGAMTGGYLTDKLGFRLVQISSLLLSGLFFVLFGMVDNFAILCGLIVVLAFFVEAFKPANSTAIAAYAAPHNLTRSYALNRLATNIGFGFGTSVGGILAAIDYHLLFWVDGVVYALAGLLIMLLLPARDFKKEKNGQMEAENGISPWRDAYYVRFLLLVVIYMLCFIMLFRLVPVYWKEEKHLGESVIGILIGMNGIVIAMFEMVLIQYFEHRKTTAFFIVSGVIFSALSFLALVVPVLPVILGALAVLLFTVGEMLAVPYLNTFVINRSTERNRGKYAGAYSVAQAVAQIIGPTAGGLIAARWGYDVLWAALVAMSFACAYGFSRLFRGPGG